MTSLRNKEMWTEEHWILFNQLEDIYRTKFSGEKFGSNYKEFKTHMLYILEVMDQMYGDK